MEQFTFETFSDGVNRAETRDFFNFYFLFSKFFEDAGEVFFDDVEAFFDSLTGVVFATACHNADQKFVLRDVEDGGGFDVARKMFGNPFGLPDVAREAVEDDVFAGLADFFNFFVHNSYDFFVGDEFAFFEDFVELASVAQDLSDGQPFKFVLFGEDLTLGGFATASQTK